MGRKVRGRPLRPAPVATPELMIRVQQAALTSGVRRGCAALSEAQGQFFVLRAVRGRTRHMPEPYLLETGQLPAFARVLFSRRW